MVKEVPASETEKGYVRTHVSFQSTGPCNISTVNALNACSSGVQTKERGRAQRKRYWGIEMNEARYLYLGTYWGVDRLDHMIKNANMFYRSWKYWHSAMIHAKAMAVVVAYDMYLECTEGQIDEDWLVEQPVSFWEF